MEEVGAQVAPPIFIHQTLPGSFRDGGSLARKRDLSYQTPNFQLRHHSISQQMQQHQRDNWNPKAWEWDSLQFVAKPLDAQGLELATPSAVDLNKSTNVSSGGNSNLKQNAAEEDGSLQLNLGGGLNFVEEPVSRPNKKFRSVSPGSGNYPMCQVDDCKENLSKAKDYHRRHKVCEIHSKSTKALVGNQMQRFCQQCSRFHLLTEFDEGKRSCRRRLAGHNRRRRKTQPEDVTARVVLNGDQNSTNSGNLDIANLLRALARTQGNHEDNNINCSSMTERDELIKILSKINALPLPMDLTAKLSSAGILNNKNSGQPSSENQMKLPGVSTSSSTMDLLAVLSATLAASAPDALAILSKRISESCNSEKSKVSYAHQVISPEKPKGPSVFPSVGAERSSNCYQSTNDDSDCQIQETRQSLPLQLFSSPDDYSPPKLSSSRKYYSSDSSNPIEEISPSSSPPVVQKLFPLQSMADTVKSEKISPNRDANPVLEGRRSRVGTVPLELFRESRGADHGSAQTIAYRGGYTSSSASDHSSPSQTSDSQERTERIIFKLFDKNPSHFPGTLRTQIYNWLSNSPTEMESYIRPGCIVLSVYLSMQSAVMEQFERNLLQHVDSLVHNKDSEFWRSGRFLMRAGRQLVSHNDGKTRICKSRTECGSPVLISVTPLAVVCGQETSLLLRGRNLTNPGARIHCTYMGGYTSREHNGVTYSGTAYDEINVSGFKIFGESPNMLGRFFIEVENGFKGNSLPIIIADANICKELRLLESELDDVDKLRDNVSEQADSLGHARSREEVVHFLNELGWLFQKKRLSLDLKFPDYSLNRFKFLLIFSTERDCCVLVKTILDMLVEKHLDKDGLSKECVDMLSEVHLLNRAVKRRFRKMVDLLVHYSIPMITDGSSSKKYIFPPNLVGPGGITALHLVACTSGSEDLVDALTNDPQEIGLSCWSSVTDATGQSPSAYAIMTKNESYNRLVAGKLTDRRNGQVTLTVISEIEKEHSVISNFQQRHKSCAKCAIIAAKYSTRVQRTQGLLQRPYIHSMLAVAAVCVCVCLFFRGAPDIGSICPFKWENLEYGVL